MITFRLKHVEASVAALSEFPRRLHRKVMAKAIRAGGRPFLQAARNGAPRGNNLLKRSLALVVRRYKSAVVVVIGQDKKKTFHRARRRKKQGGISGRGDVVPIHLVENDTAAHEVSHVNSVSGANYSRVKMDDGWVTIAAGRPLRHPGTKGKHFMRKAAVSAESSAIHAFETKFTEETDREIAKALAFPFG